MKIIETIQELRKELQPHRSNAIGLVPTMGYLHEGHLSLIRRAKQECNTVVVSIFVNPLQFGPNEDFERYPRDLERDAQLAEEVGADLLFTPSAAEMYPRPIRTRVTVAGLTERLCGASRPGHFDGVTTVVSKLFHIVEPDRAYFGQKDAQQAAVIQQMVQDLNFPLEVIVCPTVREPDGLALSSRNVYLSEEERRQATVLFQSLQEAEKRWRDGAFSSAAEMEAFIRDRIETQPLAVIDYVSVLRYPALELPEDLHGPLIVAVAVFFGKTRLIDNVVLPGKEEAACFAR
ncbi:pantoate--beta-alanine ligase [Marinithermofilum abyssi]|uniref:Pantothenate synthetase n=1 Tax=Marinithermofilum abyssi TaxID=1571185 RepID=A0A8J2VES9_9BACL|nr:pantoate--beta-alanine ligase [Marinithermofilum abyssi]GGE11632.1 pantoate--beta-alanine ligase [Marinithermofilum abyssi]